MKPSLLTSCELGMPGRRGQDVAAGERAVRGDAALEGDVAVGRPARAVGEGLELVVALARQEDLGVAVARDVLAGDAHAPDLHRHPAVGRRVEARRLPPVATRQSCSSPST